MDFLCYFVSSEYFADEAGLGRREDEVGWVWKLEMTWVELNQVGRGDWC